MAEPTTGARGGRRRGPPGRARPARPGPPDRGLRPALRRAAHGRGGHHHPGRVRGPRRLPRRPAARGRPGRPAGPVGLDQLHRLAHLGQLLGAAPQQRRRRRPLDGHRRPVRGARGLRHRPARVPRSRGRVHGVHAGPAVPGDGRDPAAAHPRPGHRAARQPARPGPAGGGLRAAPDDHHPAAVLPEHPEGARGRRGDRRLRPARLLLPHPAAAVEAGPGHRRGARPGLELEPVPAAAGDAVRRRRTGRCPWA